MLILTLTEYRYSSAPFVEKTFLKEICAKQKIMVHGKGYDGEYYSEADECLDEFY